MRVIKIRRPLAEYITTSPSWCEDCGKRVGFGRLSGLALINEETSRKLTFDNTASRAIYNVSNSYAYRIISLTRKKFCLAVDYR